MGDAQRQLSYRRAEWFDGVGELINRSEVGTPEDIAYIEGCIRSGAYLLYRVELDGELVGIFTAYVSTLFNGRKVLNIVHVVSVEQVEGSFMLAIEPLIGALAKASGFDEWRAFSQRPAMNRLLARNGFKVSEIVFFKEV